MTSTTGTWTAGGDAGRPALARCLGIPADDFARDHWGRHPLLSPAGTAAERYGDLFSLEAVDELLSRRGLRTPFLRVAKGGRVVDSSRYTRSGGVGAQVADQVADDRVLELFADGHTIVFQGLHRLWPPIIDFATALTTDLGHPVQVNAYVTPRSSQGFSAHYDVHDVFVLQIAGPKRWRVHEPVLPEPLRDEPWTDDRGAVEAKAAQQPLLEATLRSGDALYLPRGFLHAAEALGEVSVHLTVGIHPVTRSALVSAVAELVSRDPALRSSLPLGVDVADPHAIEPDVSATIEAMVARLRSVTPAEVARALATTAVASGRPAPIGPLAQAAALDHLDNDTVLVARAHQRHIVVDAGDEIVVELPGHSVRLPAATRKAVRALLSGARVAVRDLPGLDGGEALALVRKLVRSGAVTVASPEYDDGPDSVAQS